MSKPVGNIAQQSELKAAKDRKDPIQMMLLYSSSIDTCHCFDSQRVCHIEILTPSCLVKSLRQLLSASQVSLDVSETPSAFLRNEVGIPLEEGQVIYVLLFYSTPPFVAVLARVTNKVYY